MLLPIFTGDAVAYGVRTSDRTGAAYTPIDRCPTLHIWYLLLHSVSLTYVLHSEFRLVWALYNGTEKVKTCRNTTSPAPVYAMISTDMEIGAEPNGHHRNHLSATQAPLASTWSSTDERRSRRPPMTPRLLSSQSMASELQDSKHDPNMKLSIRERIKHFTWTWFTMTMATGGIANVLYQGM